MRFPAGRCGALLTGVLAGLLLAACGADEPAPGKAPRAPGSAEEKLGLERQVLAAQADLAGRLDVTPDAVRVIEAREVTWADTSLGCPEPGQMYAQVLTPGVLVVLGHAGQEYAYHAGTGRLPALCPEARARPPVGEAIPAD